LFLSELGGSNGLDLARLAAAEVSSFLGRECPKRSVSGARDLVCALRSLVRYLHLAGLITSPLVWSVPSMADLRDRTLARGLEPTAVRQLLASCDRRKLVGRRDFAILLLLARLGLRVGEVTAITLDDDTRRWAIRVNVLHKGTLRVLFDHLRETRTRRPAMPRCSGWWALPLQRPGVMECRAPWGWMP
jgi:integrase